MGLKIGKRGEVPNWLKFNDWSFSKRIIIANEIMAFSSRDWSISFNRGDIPESPDPEKWALWCLITQDTKQEALEAWWGFCDQYTHNQANSADQNCRCPEGDALQKQDADYFIKQQAGD